MSYFKFPRTPHLVWSKGTTSDDRILKSVNHFVGKEVVVSEKCDGESCTMYPDHIHARSMDSLDHPSRAWVKQLHGQIKHDIPKGFRLCGENLFARHSIHYANLESYFYLFGVYNDQNICLSWDEIKEWAALLGLVTVPELWRGVWDEEKVRACYTGTSVFGCEQEGYVARTADAFPYSEYGGHVAKMVRQHHVRTSSHWMIEPLVKNTLRSQ